MDDKRGAFGDLSARGYLKHKTLFYAQAFSYSSWQFNRKSKVGLNSNEFLWK